MQTQNNNQSLPRPQRQNLGRPDAFVPVYNGDYSSNNADSAPSKVPANPIVSLAIVGGLILMVLGIGSTLMRGFQTDQEVNGKIDAAVKEALAKQQVDVAQCINTVFDGGKGGNKSAKKRRTGYK